MIHNDVEFEVNEANFKVNGSRGSRVQGSSCCWLPPLLRWPLLAAAGSARPAPVQLGSGCNWICPDLLVTSIFAGEVSSRACSSTFMCCAGMALSQWQHTLCGNRKIYIYIYISIYIKVETNHILQIMFFLDGVNLTTWLRRNHFGSSAPGLAPWAKIWWHC